MHSCEKCNASHSCSALSTGLPLHHAADQWNVDFITELLDLVEEPPEVDTEDQVPDSIVNVILSFNQHFQGACIPPWRAGVQQHRLVNCVQQSVIAVCSPKECNGATSVCYSHTFTYVPILMVFVLRSKP